MLGNKDLFNINLCEIKDKNKITLYNKEKV